MADRRHQIALLIGSRFDFTFEPETFTSQVVRRAATRAKAGGSPSHWQPCDTCDEAGFVTRFRKLQPCPDCQGVGKVRVDDYTGQVVVTDEARDVTLAELIRRDTKHVKCPDCQDLRGVATGVVHGQPCRRCDGTGDAPVPGSWLRPPGDRDDRVSGDALDAMLAAIVRRDQVGSYHELDHALAALARARPYIARLLDQAYLHRTLDLERLPIYGHTLLEIGLVYVDLRMPDPIVVPRDVVANERARRERRPVNGRALNAVGRLRRDKEIRQLARAGRAPQWLAREYGLSVSSVYAIVNQRAEVAS